MCTDLINHEEFEIAEGDAKLDLILTVLDTINSRFEIMHNIINEASDGLDPRLDTVNETAKDNSDRLEALEVENAQLRKEAEILKGVIFKYDTEIASMWDKLTKLTTRSMANNVIISGIEDDKQDPKEESCKSKVKTFLTKTLKVEHEDKHIQVAHRLGKFKDGKNCSMVVRCHPVLKDKILSNKKKLKGKKNKDNQAYFIEQQLPDQWTEEKRECFQYIKKAKKEAKDDEEDVDIEVKDRVVYINKQPMRKYLTPPKPRDLFVDKHEQDKIDKIKQYHSDPITEMGSTFQAFAVKCSSITEVKRAYVKMRQMYPNAAHILAAYRIRNGDGYQDDREYGAANKVLKLMEENQAQNMAIFVVRQYDGQHIGPKRHIIIKQATLELLAAMKLRQDTAVKTTKKNQENDH